MNLTFPGYTYDSVVQEDWHHLLLLLSQMILFSTGSAALPQVNQAPHSEATCSSMLTHGGYSTGVTTASSQLKALLLLREPRPKGAPLAQHCR